MEIIHLTYTYVYYINLTVKVAYTTHFVMAAIQVINEHLLKYILETHHRRKIGYLKYTTNGATSCGDNHCSEMERATVTYIFQDEQNDHTVSMIVKYLPDDEFHRAFVSGLNMFDCEIKMYQLILPELFTLGLPKIVPRTYYTTTFPQPLLVLEDLSVSGYRNLPRSLGFNLEQSQLTIENLARFHATTVALHHRDPTILPQFNKTIFQRTEHMMQIMDVCYEKVTETCQNHTDLKKYGDKLRFAKEYILNHIYDACNDTNFKVLNHGDFWANNIMFRYSADGKLENLAFIDFQCSCFTSPCYDLHYFIATSLQLDVKQRHSIIVDHYFNQLLGSLTQLGIKTLPNREEFDDDFRRMSYYGFGASIFQLAFIKARQAEGASFENFVRHGSIGSFQHHCYFNEEYVKEMVHFLPFYNSLGIFDVPQC